MRQLILLLATTSLLAAGCNAQISGDPADAGRLSPGQAMSSKRAAHTATLLPDGTVLIAGGLTRNQATVSTAELYDPTRNSFTRIADMADARAGHTATRLSNGKVLVAGGYSGEYLITAELYDPTTRRFTSAGRMTTGRSGHTATTLKDGRVLLVGGVGVGWSFLSTAEIYDPTTESFRATGSMSVPRESHTATVLSDGSVFVTGGHAGRRRDIQIYTGSELYDPKTGQFTIAAEMTIKRHKHEAVLLDDGRVFIVGGADERDGDGAYRTAEIYDPVKRSFSKVANEMTTARYKLQGAVVVMPNGKVLIGGGADRVEVFDPQTNRFVAVPGDMRTKRLFATATLLGDGRVLILGGYSDGNTVSDGAWLYKT